jgi:hypothetical protein
LNDPPSSPIRRLRESPKRPGVTACGRSR